MRVIIKVYHHAGKIKYHPKLLEITVKSLWQEWLARAHLVSEPVGELHQRFHFRILYEIFVGYKSLEIRRWIFLRLLSFTHL